MSNALTRYWRSFGRVGYQPGALQLDPNHWKTAIPMSLPGDRVWQGMQKDNAVGGLLHVLPNTGNRNLYQTTQERTERIQQNTGGKLSQNAIGPTLFDVMMQAGG